jgi:hypothetical protein
VLFRSFFVLKGSAARGEWAGAGGGYENLYRQMIEDGALVPGENGLMVFTDDQSFSSPSAAAAVVAGRSANGRISWIVQHTGKTYGAWQDEQVSAVVSESDDTNKPK